MSNEQTDKIAYSGDARESKAGGHFYGTYKSCPRMFFLRYVLGFQPEFTRKALIFGGAMHTAIENYYLCFERELQPTVEAFEKDLFYRQEEYELGTEYEEDLRCGKLFLTEWHETWKEHDLKRYRLIEVEQPYEIPLGPEEEFIFTLRVDRIMQDTYSDEYFVFDTKTTRWSVFGTMKSVEADDQMTSYIWAVRKAHPDWHVESAVVDIIYGRGRKVEAQRPGVVIRDKYALAQYEAGLYGTISEVSAKVKALDDVPSEVLFPRNGSHCAKFGCDFAPVCRNRAEFDRVPPGFVRDSWLEGEEAKRLLKLPSLDELPWSVRTECAEGDLF